MLTAVDFVERHPRRDRYALHDLDDRRQDALVVCRVVDMVDVERLGDIAERHVRRADIDKLAGFECADGLGIDIIRDHCARRPHYDNHASLIQRRPDLRVVSGAGLQLVIPPHRTGAVLCFEHAGKLAGQFPMLGRIADKNRLHRCAPK